MHKPVVLALLGSLALLFAPAPGGMAAAVAAETRITPARLPSIPLLDSAGGPADLAAWTDKPMVLNVWATWCPPCRKEMPALQTLGERLAPQGVRVVALSVDRDANLVKEFMLKYGITLPAPIASSASVAFSALDAFALPVTFYVRRDGTIVGKVLGTREWDDEKVAREVLDALRVSPAAPAARAADLPQ